MLEETFTGHFTDNHAFLLERMLARIDAINTDLAALESKIEETVLPFEAAIARLDEIPGVGRVAAAVIVAEVGLDMSRFPTPGHLASWRGSLRGSRIGGQEEGQRGHRARQPLPGSHPG